MDSLLIKVLAAYFQSGLRGSTRLTDFLSSRIAGLQAARIPTPKGEFFGDLRHPVYRGLFTLQNDETDEEIIMKQFVRPGDVAYDIGVYFGIYTSVMSQLVGTGGTVHSFEPNPILLPSLRSTVAEIPNAILHEIALSEDQGEVKFFVPVGDTSMSGLAAWTGTKAGSVREYTCKTRTIDDLIESGSVAFPNFIKCDVEGAELAVFRGAQAALDAENAPVIFFEVNPEASHAFGYEPDGCFRLLDSMRNPRYRFFEVLDGSISRVRRYGELRFNRHGFTNALAVPEIRLTSVPLGADDVEGPSWF